MTIDYNQMNKEELIREIEKINSEKFKFFEIMNSLKIGIIIFNKSKKIIYTNKEFNNFFSYHNNELLENIGSRFSILNKSISFDDIFSVEKSIPKNTTLNVEETVSKKNIWLKINRFVYSNKNDAEVKIILTFHDVTSSTKSKEKYKENQNILKSIFDKTPVGICITDENGYFEDVNKSYEKMYKYSKKELIGKHFTMIVPEENRTYLNKVYFDFIKGKRELRGEWDVIDKFGMPLTILADAARIVNKNSSPKKVTFAMDITNEKKLREELKYKAKIDGLTGLFNHNTIIEKLEEELVISKIHNKNLSILMIDIDNFKLINDKKGHLTGDLVLKFISGIITKNLRKEDFAGRYGGEEFLVILSNTNKAEATLIAERIRKSIEIHSEKNGNYVTVSIGVSENWFDNYLKFISDADEKLYRAKENGKNRIEL